MGSLIENKDAPSLLSKNEAPNDLLLRNGKFRGFSRGFALFSMKSALRR
jgi:hypothetical protein